MQTAADRDGRPDQDARASDLSRTLTQLHITYVCRRTLICRLSCLVLPLDDRCRFERPGNKHVLCIVNPPVSHRVRSWDQDRQFAPTTLLFLAFPCLVFKHPWKFHVWLHHRSPLSSLVPPTIANDNQPPTMMFDQFDSWSLRSLSLPSWDRTVHPIRSLVISILSLVTSDLRT